MKEPDIPHDFRRLPAEGAQTYSPALRHEIRLAYRRRTLALDLAGELEVKLWRSFPEARDYVRTLGLRNGAEWGAFANPANYPQIFPLIQPVSTGIWAGYPVVIG